MPVVAVIATVLLIGAWLLALRAQLRRGDAAGDEWRGAQDRPRLWTSGARCRRCGAAGGVVEDRDGGVSFSCLQCGWQQQRRTRG